MSDSEYSSTKEDKVVDLSSRKIESLSRICLSSPKRNDIIGGGGGGGRRWRGILDTDITG